MKQGAPTPLMLITVFSTSQTPNKLGNRRQELSATCLNRVKGRIFISTNVNHKYGTFEANFKPFDMEWNYIQHVFLKFIPFLVIWSWKFNTMLKNNITFLRNLVNRVCGTAVHIFPHWISKPRI